MKERIQTAAVAVIGGGASGLMAAIAAARGLRDSKTKSIKHPGEPSPNDREDRVVVLERCDRIGRKLLATGNGRCNFSNTGIESALYHPAPWVEQVYSMLPPVRIHESFESMGLMIRCEDGRLYPASGTGTSVLDVLRLELDRLQVALECDFSAIKLLPKKGGWLLEAADGRQLLARRVILAAGGKASPQLGSDGSGYALFTGLGHGLRPIEPALTGLRCPVHEVRSLGLKSLNGVRLQAKADWYQAAFAGDKMVLKASETGEILFREYGLSGIAIFQLSRWTGPGEIRLDLFPELRFEDLLQKLIQMRQTLGWRSREAFLVGTLHKRVIQVLMQQASLQAKGTAADFTDADLKKLAGSMKDWRFPMAGNTGWQQAQITLGGLSVQEFDPLTLESKIQPGLYAAGEILDVDGPCGGFNLHWAWTSGWLAGTAAALSLSETKNPLIRKQGG